MHVDLPPDALTTCHRCQRSFTPRFRFQVDRQAQAVFYYCSQRCRDPGLAGQSSVTCQSCQTSFVPQLALHVQEHDGVRRYFCSTACLPPAFQATGQALGQAPVAHSGAASAASAPRTARVLAVLNQKGGTAKTTTALSVAAGLATLGHATLLMDLDPQGNVGVSLGMQSPRSVYHLLTAKTPPEHCWCQVRPNLQVITSDENLATAELELGRLQEPMRSTRLAQVMRHLQTFDYVIVDCAPALSLVNYNALFYAGEVLIPVSCDYLALVGVKQVLRTLRRVTEQTGRQVRVAGVLPTFYDVRKKLSLEALNYLRKTFGARALPPVRVNTKLAEAPSHKKTIFEYAADSHGAKDYMRVVQWLTTGETAALPPLPLSLAQSMQPDLVGA